MQILLQPLLIIKVFHKTIMQLLVFLMQHIKHYHFPGTEKNFSVINYFFKLQKYIFMCVYTHTHMSF